MTGIINFNFTHEQQERFNLILDETKKLHPNLMVDDISKERIKVLIAYSVINDDKPLKEETKSEENVFDEIIE